MQRPAIHLRVADVDDDLAMSACAVVTINWSTDPQAVTCQKCIGKMDLQPA
jgi:hypothetical protein